VIVSLSSMIICSNHRNFHVNLISRYVYFRADFRKTTKPFKKNSVHIRPLSNMQFDVAYSGWMAF